jgi:hypothetical protein
MARLDRPFYPVERTFALALPAMMEVKKHNVSVYIQDFIISSCITYRTEYRGLIEDECRQGWPDKVK